MQISCGTDIIEIDRIKEAIEKLGDTFLEKIYTQKEIEYCQSKGRNQYQHYAARFAAKEAIFKAISSMLKDKYSITWTDAEILNNEQGKPIIYFIKGTYPRIKNIELSLSHCKEYAVATVVAIIE